MYFKRNNFLCSPYSYLHLGGIFLFLFGGYCSELFFVKSVRKETFWQIFLFQILTFSYMKPLNIHHNIMLSLASECLDTETYIQWVKMLINKSLLLDPTLVPHSEEEIWRKYQSSIVAMNNSNNSIVWNTSIYPTTFDCLDSLRDFCSIWESWSTVVDPEFRWKSIGKELILHADRYIWSQYDAIIWATINPLMLRMRMDLLWYKIVPFPKDLYEEWRQFFSKRLPGWELEFQDRAKCILKINTTSIGDAIMNILLSQ